MENLVEWQWRLKPFNTIPLSEKIDIIIILGYQMNDIEIKTEANNTVIPETIGGCILLFIFNFIFMYISHNDFYGRVVLATVATLILSPLIYYFKLF